MVVRRRQLNHMLVAERNRLYPSHPQSRKSIDNIIDALQNELDRINEQMKQHMTAFIRGAGQTDRQRERRRRYHRRVADCRTTGTGGNSIDGRLVL